MKLGVGLVALLLMSTSVWAAVSPGEMVEAVHSRFLWKLSGQAGNAQAHAFKIAAGDATREIHVFNGSDLLGQSPWWRAWQAAAPRSFVFALHRSAGGVTELMVGLTIRDAKEAGRIMEVMELGVDQSLAQVGLQTAIEGVPRASLMHDGMLLRETSSATLADYRALEQLGLRASDQTYLSVRLEDLTEYQTSSVYRAVWETADRLFNEGYDGILDIVGRAH